MNSERFDGCLHVVKRLLTTHSHVAVVFLSHQFLEDTYHLRLLFLLNQQIDDLGAHAGVLVRQEHA